MTLQHRADGSLRHLLTLEGLSRTQLETLLQRAQHWARSPGDIAPRYRFCGRKPMIVSAHQSQMRALLASKNDLTLKELREATGLKCSLQAINVVLGKMGLTYKKRHSAPASKTVRMSPGRAGFGASGRRALTRPS